MVCSKHFTKIISLDETNKMTVTQLPRQNSVRNGKIKARFEQVEEIRNRIQTKKGS